MVFSSNIFLFLFLPVALAVNFLLPKITWRNVFLLAMSLLFYAWGEPRFVVIMIASILINYACAMAIARVPLKSGRARALLVVAVVTNLGILFCFKYLNFTLNTLRRVLPEAGIPVTSIVLPIGISFFLFQGLSYVIDVYRGTVPVQRKVWNLGLYVSFFPQLIAGPIVRYSTIAEQIEERSVSQDDFAEGARRFIIGLGKKVMLANTLALAADKAFSLAGTAELSVPLAWVGAIAYSFQILFDFSGYSDMAIGMGRMFGFHFDENFIYPYGASSVAEVWRRWHISLGTWFRDYVFFPLGGSRVSSKAKLVRNYFIIWFLTGLWHGANWTYVAWGLWNFVLVTGEKLSGMPGRIKGRVSKQLYRVLALLGVLAGMVVFRSTSLRAAGTYFRRMVGLGAGPWTDGLTVMYLRENAVFFVVAALCSVPFFPWVKRKLRIGERTSEVIALPVYLGLFVLCISYLVVGGHNPFIYFNF